MRNFVSFFLLFAATCTAGFAAAQNSGSQTIDIEAIRASAKAHEDEAEALAENIRTRSEAVRDDARRTQDRAKVNRERYANSVVRKRASKKVEVFDFDAMIARERVYDRLGLRRVALVEDERVRAVRDRQQRVERAKRDAARRASDSRCDRRDSVAVGWR